MKKEWESFKSIKGSQLIGIYENKLDVSLSQKEIILHCVEPILQFRQPISMEISYWKIGWMENNEGDDLLILKEQKTPEPLEYKPIDSPSQKHIILSSSFSIAQKEVKKVSGYGYKDENTEFLSCIVLEFSSLYISIHAGAVIETRISDNRPADLGHFIFSA